MEKPKRDSRPEGYVPKGTLYAVAVVCAALGFFGGIVFSALKSVPDPRTANPNMSSQVKTPEKASANSEELMLRIKTLEGDTAKNPGNGAAWADLGNAYFDADQPEKAIQAYEKAIELKPGNADVLTDLGVMYRRAGKSDKAIETFEKAMTANPSHEISRYNKGIVLLHDLNDMEGAIRAWEDLIRVNPDFMTPTGQSVKQMVDGFKSRKGSVPGGDKAQKP